MTQEDLKLKVINAEAKVAKLIQKGADKFDISIKQSDIESAVDKLEEAKQILANWQAKLDERIAADDYLEANAPEILKDFLENWKQHAIVYYREKRIHFIEYRKELKAQERAARLEALQTLPSLERYRESKSSSLRYLNGPFLDTLIDAAGCSSAFLTSELDLTTDDGLKDYGTCNVTIFLLTVDQYRRNRDVIPNADDWWWLSTAVSTASNGYEHSARIVHTDGTLYGYYACLGNGGLRPACYLDSDLLISFDEQDVTAEQAGDIVKELIESFGGSFATEEQLRAAASFVLGTLRATREQEAAHE